MTQQLLSITISDDTRRGLTRQWPRLQSNLLMFSCLNRLFLYPLTSKHITYLMFIYICCYCWIQHLLSLGYDYKLYCQNYYITNSYILKLICTRREIKIKVITDSRARSLTMYFISFFISPKLCTNKLQYVTFIYKL